MSIIRATTLRIRVLWTIAVLVPLRPSAAQVASNHASGRANDQNTPASDSTARIDSLVQVTSPCFGPRCPGYRLRITPAGEVSLALTGNAADKHLSVHQLPRDTIAALLAAVRTAGFYGLPRRISYGTSLCPVYMTDQGTVTVTVYRNTATTTVEQDWGCAIPPVPPEPAQRLAAFRRWLEHINSVAQVRQWLGTIAFDM
ncbi:MAG: hypothetical protein ACR2GG_07395 [Gemmatimonadaceae bacterium]